MVLLPEEKPQDSKYFNNETCPVGTEIIVTSEALIQPPYGKLTFIGELPDGTEKTVSLGDKNKVAIMQVFGRETKEWVGRKLIYEGSDKKIGNKKGRWFKPVEEG